ncbi:TPA: LPXTG cell wall anchor domain-containing protein [Streptococcus suis]|nr:LPXTG cell wall anchor domain-containing protein [Streptococcus suis]
MKQILEAEGQLECFLPVTGEKGSLWLLTSGIIGLAIALFTRKL